LATTDEDEVALRDGKRFVRRLEAKPIPDWEAQHVTAPTDASDANAVYEIALDGSERRPRRASRVAPGPGEVEIQVEVATLTRGTSARGKRGNTTPWPIEIAGVVAAVGPDVSSVAIGQRIQ